MPTFPFISRLRQRGEERKSAEDKAIAKAMDAVYGAMRAEEHVSKAGFGSGLQPGSSWTNQQHAGGANAALIARVTQNLASSFNRAPEDLEQAMAQQGMSWGPPFSPGRPLDPFWGYRGAPRTRDYTVGENTQITPRWNRISFTTIKALWDAYDVAQICTKHLINDVRTLDYHFEAAIGVREDVSDDIIKARTFFDSPDKRQPFQAWVAEYLMDVIRYDAGALYIRRNMAGDPIALEVVSGTTLIPNSDYYGRIATDEDDEDPNLTPAGTFGGTVTPAYTQIIQGMPWDWLAADDIIYQPWNPLPESMYGLAPLEAVLLTANTDLRFQWHFLNFFTQGSIPTGFMEAPPELSDPAQIAEWQQQWDALMIGDQQKLRQIRWVPAGAKYQPVGAATQAFNSEFPLYLMRRTCAAHGITPSDLGFTETVNKATSETQVDVQFRVGTMPLVRHLEGVINLFLIEHLKLRVRLRFDTGREMEDRLSTAQAEQIYINSGVLSPDEPRTRLGYPIDLNRPTPRYINNARSGPVPLIALESLSGKIDPETYGPTKDAPLIDHPFVPIPGVMPPIGSQDAKNADNSTAAMQANLVASSNGTPAPYPDGGTGTPASPPVSTPKGKPTVGVGTRKSTDDDLEGAITRLTALLRVVKGEDCKAAGIVVVAQDSGRVLMIQRDNDDPAKKASGRWEFPGGRCNPGENAWAAAKREWQEETGNKLPSGEQVDDWDGKKGYRLFVYAVKAESDVNLNPDRAAMEVVDADHPNAQKTEVMAWWDPKDAADAGKALRKELRDFDWDLVTDAVRKEVTAGVTSATGIQGSGLIGATFDGGEDDEDEDDDEKAQKVAIQLRQWRENSRNRLRKGLTPRRFVSVDLPSDVSDAIWSTLSTATTREAVDNAFKDADPKALTRPEPGTAEIRAALAALVTSAVQHEAIRAALGTVEKSGSPARNAALGVLMAPELAVAALLRALMALWPQAGLRGAREAAALLGLPVPDTLPTLGEYAKLTAAANAITGGIAQAMVFEIADTIANQAAAGATEEQAVQAVADAISLRASVIASVEQRKAAHAAQMDVYRQAHVQKIAWVGGTCNRCKVNAAASPIAIHNSWPDGPPPVHPECQCSVRPA